jgi:hypothetical protein
LYEVSRKDKFIDRRHNLEVTEIGRMASHIELQFRRVKYCGHGGGGFPI